MTALTVDVDLNVREGVSGDPDGTSQMLQEFNRQLYSKPLPSGGEFMLVPAGSVGQLALIAETPVGPVRLSADTIANSNRARLKVFYSSMTPEENARFHSGGVAARILFPKRTGSINQERGTNHRIEDRFDLTLECIRRFYDDDLDTPLGTTLSRDRAFFDLFGSFEGYVDFFLLQDLVDRGRVRLYLPERGFDAPPLPATMDEYRQFRAAQVDFVSARRERMRVWVEERNADLAHRL